MYSLDFIFIYSLDESECIDNNSLLIIIHYVKIYIS